MPKQNRPLVRDGRLQSRKRRTDRSYLRQAQEPEAPAEEEVREEEQPEAAAEPASEPAANGATAAEPEEATAPAATAVRPSKLPTAVRALQQQGVRKRRDVNARAVMERDSRYAMHELRRIFILTAMVVATLIVLAIVLR